MGIGSVDCERLRQVVTSSSYLARDGFRRLRWWLRLWDVGASLLRLLGVEFKGKSACERHEVYKGVVVLVVTMMVAVVVVQGSKNWQSCWLRQRTK